jgi:hypothetical protein
MSQNTEGLLMAAETSVVELEEVRTEPGEGEEQGFLASRLDEPHETEVDLTVDPSLDSLRLYLRAIGRVPLLSAEEEVCLAKRIERGVEIGFGVDKGWHRIIRLRAVVRIPRRALT